MLSLKEMFVILTCENYPSPCTVVYDISLIHPQHCGSHIIPETIVLHFQVLVSLVVMLVLAAAAAQEAHLSVCGSLGGQVFNLV